jgi:hypothetical protein
MKTEKEEKNFFEIKKTVENLGGKMWVERNGKERIFYIELPHIEKREMIKRRQEIIKNKEIPISVRMKEAVKDLLQEIEDEKKKWIKGTRHFNLEAIKKGNLKEKFLRLVSLFLDWFLISRFFNLQKKWIEMFIQIPVYAEFKDQLFSMKDFYFHCKRFKKIDKQLRFLDENFSKYCQLDFSYYQRLQEILSEKFCGEKWHPEFLNLLREIQKI